MITSPNFQYQYSPFQCTLFEYLTINILIDWLVFWSIQSCGIYDYITISFTPTTNSTNAKMNQTPGYPHRCRCEVVFQVLINRLNDKVDHELRNVHVSPPIQKITSSHNTLFHSWVQFLKIITWRAPQNG